VNQRAETVRKNRLYTRGRFTLV